MMTKELDHWNAGIPMYAAPLHFARKELRDQWQELEKTSALQAGHDYLKAAPPKNSSWFDLIGTAFIGMQCVLGPRNEVISEAQNDLLVRILKGEFVAFGFEAPRRLASAAVEIPNLHWQGNVRWDKSELTHQNLHFVEIRLVHFSTVLMAELEAKAVEEHAEFASGDALIAPGRPSIKEHITDAFYALHAEGKINRRASARSHFPLVRDWLSKHRPELEVTDTRPSNEGIRQYFAPLFRGI